VLGHYFDELGREYDGVVVFPVYDEFDASKRDSGSFEFLFKRFFAGEELEQSVGE